MHTTQTAGKSRFHGVAYVWPYGTRAARRGPDGTVPVRGAIRARRPGRTYVRKLRSNRGNRVYCKSSALTGPETHLDLAACRRLLRECSNACTCSFRHEMANWERRPSVPLHYFPLHAASLVRVTDSSDVLASLCTRMRKQCNLLFV